MMKLKLKKKAKIVIVIGILLIAAIILYLIFTDNSYEVEYEINGYNVRESYNDKEKLYSFVIEKNKIKHAFYQSSKYLKKHQLINDIKAIDVEEETCLLVDTSFDVMPLCSNKDEAIDYRLTSSEMKENFDIKSLEENIKTYDNYTMYNDIGYTFIIWNYKDLIRFDDDIKVTNILSSDPYNIDLATKINEYILIPDYDSKYDFHKFYIYNIEKGTKEEMPIDYEISYDSYILGTYKDSVYLVDKKKKVEYEIMPSKKKIRIVGSSKKKGTILTKEGFEKISITKLCNEKMAFYNNNKYEYEIIDGKIYQVIDDAKMRISDLEVKDIIRVEDDNVLYLVDDTLYFYNIKYGEVKLISNFEWKFNYENFMFLYIP